ncbi:hypothetical protein [Nocardioides sp.]|uniref:hypothetical protein n=1 Tax=Nocardioides sp. TaxID=35761 RepID=UPI002C10DDEF|nr:hypothetical protein [Nocardioides sp.]HXH77319.1 hypothetical protein [Nocardioides sp.]
MEEVGIRLSLAGRRETAAGLAATKDDLEVVADAAKDVDTAGRQAARGLEKASSPRFSRGFDSITKGARGLFGFLGRGAVAATRGAVVGVTALSIALGATSVKAIGLASDANETASAFGTVLGPAAGRTQKDLDGLSKRFGLYGADLQSAATGFATLGKMSGQQGKGLSEFSTGLVRAGLDLGSFYNARPEEVMGALQSGLTGEAEGLKRFNIFMSDAALNAFAVSKGLTQSTQDMSEQQKVALRHAFIMANLGDAQGDLTRTSEGFANQQRGATGRVQTFMRMLGGPLTTAATGVFKGFNVIAQRGIGMLRRELPGLQKDAGGVSETMTRWGRQIARGLPDTLQKVGGLVSDVRERAGRLSAAWGGLKVGKSGAQFREAGAGLSVIGASLKGVDLTKLADGFSSGLNDSVSVFGVVIGFAADHVDTLGKYMPLLIGAFIAYKGAQALANIAAIAALPITVANIGANIALTSSNRALATQLAITNNVEKVGIITRARGTVATVASTVAGLAASAATKVWAAGQWLLNAALTANPIGLVVVGIALLVGGLVLAYKKSETFRTIVDSLWNGVLKPFGAWIGGALLKYVTTLAQGWLMMGRFGVMAFRFLLTAAFKAFDGILSAAEAGLGWVKGVGDKIRGAREAFDAFGDSTINKLQGVEAKLRSTQAAIDGLARDRSSTITIATVYTSRSAGKEASMGAFGIPGVANGGHVQRGLPYIVGERRAELLVPSVSGRILPRVPDSPADLEDIDPGAFAGSSVGRSKQPVHIHVDVDGRQMTEVVINDIEDVGARA